MKGPSANRRSNLLPLMSGLLIGLILGIVLASALIHYGWKLNPIAYLKEKLIGSNQEWNKQEDNSTLLLGRDKMGAGQDEEPRARDFRARHSSAGNDGDAGEDSLQPGLSDGSRASDEAHIPLATEVMLESREIRIRGWKDQSHGLDSILLDEARSPGKREKASIEFWKSPINYKGYKWSNHKLLLFGIFPEEQIGIFFLDGKYYMQSSNGYFLLETSEKYSPLTSVSDKTLISRLGQL